MACAPKNCKALAEGPLMMWKCGPPPTTTIHAAQESDALMVSAGHSSNLRSC